jgi:hypothetical protein
VADGGQPEREQQHRQIFFTRLAAEEKSLKHFRNLPMMGDRVSVHNFIFGGRLNPKPHLRFVFSDFFPTKLSLSG